jgi:hypothetical protein
MKRDPQAIAALREEVAAIEQRSPLNRAQAVYVLCRQAGGIQCGCGCGEPLDPLGEGVRDEHVIALGYRTGTANDLGNREFWRLPCSKAKDKRDAKGLAKARRLAGETCTASGRPIPQHVSPWPPKGARKMQSRPFPVDRRKKKEAR